MTTELEQEFFRVFGIEPEFGFWCKRFDETNIADCNGIKEASKKCAKCENGYIKYRYYPYITAEKLLEMEDILLRKHIQIEYCFYNGIYYSSCTIALCNGKSKNKKDAFLEMLISIAENYLDNCDTDGEEEIFKQIQQLFKED